MVQTWKYIAPNETDNGYRQLKPGGDRYNQFFGTANGKVTVNKANATIPDTIAEIKRIVARTTGQTSKIANHLRANSLQDTCRNIWDFLYWNIQYKNDTPGHEQLREPVRSWRDRHTGIDCDCFSVFVSSILTNLRIPHSLRITKYVQQSGQPGPWQHIYVIVPTNAGYIAIDPVLRPFGYEKPYADKKDYPMQLETLSGFGTVSDALNDTLTLIQRERDRVRKNPALVDGVYNATDFVNAVDFLEKNWYDGAKRTAALNRLADLERGFNDSNGFSGALSGFGSLEDQYRVELGAIKKKPKAAADGTPAPEAPRKFFSAVKTVVQNVKAAADKNGDGKISLKELPKAALLVVASPTLAVSRRAARAVLRFNVFNISGKLASSPKAMAAAEKWWASTGGDVNGLRKAVTAGAKIAEKHGKTAPVRGLGEAVTVSASILAATPVIMQLLKILKDNGLIDKVPEEGALKKVLQDNGPKILDFFKQESEDEGGADAGSYAAQQQITAKKDGAADEQPGYGQKAMDFVTENPGTTVGVLAVTGLGIWALTSSGGSGKKMKKRGGNLGGTRRTGKKDDHYVLS